MGAEGEQEIEYRVEDRELLLRFYQVLWNPLVPKIPDGIKPNTITIVGQIACVLAAACAGLAVGGPLGLYVVSAVLLLVYVTADNVDGPHARRTGQTSPLGEYLDHGLDGMASGAVLLCTCFCLKMGGVSMAALCAMGAFAFFLTFWEQYRTGLLVIPHVSAIEGLTLVMFLELWNFFGANPAPLTFSFETLNFASVLMAVVGAGYVVAMATPIVRATRAGANPVELWQPLVIAGATALYPLAGGSALYPAIASSLLGADLTCRLILLRHKLIGQDDKASIVGLHHWLLALPAVPAMLLKDSVSPDVFGVLAMVASIGIYGTTLVVGGRRFIARAAAKTS